MKSVEVGGALSIEDVVEVSVHNAKVSVPESALRKVSECRRALEKLIASGERIYGITTGFGANQSIFIADQDERQELQTRLVLSHACGVGEPLRTEYVRAAMLLTLNSVCKGHSGVTVELVDALAGALNAGFHPIVPSRGSLGASGDLAPLAHIALALIGHEGARAEVGGKTMPAKKALEAAGLQPIVLREKEGLALVNGTHVHTGMAALFLHGARTLSRTFDIAAAMSFSALLGFEDAFAQEVQELRPQKGQMESAQRMRHYAANTNKSHAEGEVQDAYSLRCIPQVHGACNRLLEFCEEIILDELRSVTDNPLFVRDKCYSAGNFHGEPVAFALDMLCIALTELCSMSERRIARLVDTNLSRGLPAFLSEKPGANSGYMIPQYVAAACVSENRTLCHPAVVDNIPTSANQEDFVSMAMTAAHKAERVVSNSSSVAAIELAAANQGLELRVRDLPQSQQPRFSEAIAVAREIVSASVPYLDTDRPLSTEIEEFAANILEGHFVQQVENSLEA